MIPPATDSPLTLSSTALEAALRKIPLTAAMRVDIRSFDGSELTLSAPLAPNVNDKGCAFGGSLVSLLTLAGWGLMLLKLEMADRECDIYVQDSTARYIEPLWDDLTAHAVVVGGDDAWAEFIAALAARGRGRLRLSCRAVTRAGSDACTLEARFVAIARTQKSAA